VPSESPDNRLAYISNFAKGYLILLITIGSRQAFKYFRIRQPAVSVRVFEFLQICEEDGLAIHPQEDQAKFDSRSEKKVEILWNLTIFWLHARTFHLNLAISKKNSPKKWQRCLTKEQVKNQWFY
jgi:hypothetical protein